VIGEHDGDEPRFGTQDAGKGIDPNDTNAINGQQRQGKALFAEMS
jgi:hypothetical protein